MVRPGDAGRRAAGRVRAEVDDGQRGRRRGGAPGASAAAGSRPAPRTRPSRNAATTASNTGLRGPPARAHGSATWRWARRRCATRRSRATSSAVPSGSEAWSSPRSARSGEKKPDAGGRLEDPAGERLRVEPARDHVELRRPGRVVDGAALERAATQEPVVREAPARAAGRGALAGRRRLGPRRSPRQGLAASAEPPARPPLRPAPSAGARAGTAFDPARPRHVGQSCAQPSRSSGPRTVHAVAAPQAVEAGAEGHAVGSRPRVSRPGRSCRAATSRRTRRGRRSRPASRSRPPRAGRAARSTPSRRRRRRGPRGPRAGPPSPSGRGSASHAAHRRRQVQAGRHEHEDLRIHLADARPRWSAIGALALAARAAPSRRRGAPARGSSGRPPRAGRAIRARRPAGRRSRGPGAPTTISSTRLEPLAQPHDDVHRLVLGLGHRADRLDAR